MNAYASLTELKGALGIVHTRDDAALLRLLEAASREAEGPACANRVFWTKTEARYFTWRALSDALEIGDCLAISAFAEDTEADGTYDGATYTEGTDYYLEPQSWYPKRRAVALPWASMQFTTGQRLYKITGTWGAGNMRDASPWLASGVTGTVATTSGTSLTLSAATGLSVGQTWRLGTEQMYCTAISGTTATVRRGVNASTAAIQSAVSVEIALWPEDLSNAVIFLAAEAYRLNRGAGLQSETLEGYTQRFTRIPEDAKRRIFARVRA